MAKFEISTGGLYNYDLMIKILREQEKLRNVYAKSFWFESVLKNGVTYQASITLMEFGDYRLGVLSEMPQFGKEKGTRPIKGLMSGVIEELSMFHKDVPDFRFWQTIEYEKIGKNVGVGIRQFGESVRPSTDFIPLIEAWGLYLIPETDLIVSRSRLSDAQFTTIDGENFEYMSKLGKFVPIFTRASDGICKSKGFLLEENDLKVNINPNFKERFIYREEHFEEYQVGTIVRSGSFVYEILQRDGEVANIHAYGNVESVSVATLDIVTPTPVDDQWCSLNNEQFAKVIGMFGEDNYDLLVLRVNEGELDWTREIAHKKYVQVVSVTDVLVGKYLDDQMFIDIHAMTEPIEGLSALKSMLICLVYDLAETKETWFINHFNQAYVSGMIEEMIATLNKAYK